MMGFKQVFFLLLVVQNVICFTRIDPLVDSKVGLIRGLRASDGDYSMFMGIPYATVDADKPFGDAIPYPPFAGTFDAFDDSAVCPQINGDTVSGSLDCLHINVYVPTTATSRSRVPVMVYIHGGGFTHGDGRRSMLSPKFLVKNDVIVVTFNYRLGVYGFMCLDTPEASGNQGLKDQYIALKWIKNNIQAFGGDADKITLFGDSAGGHSIDLHLISTKEKLYNKVILQTGSSLAGTVLYEPDRSAALKIAKHLGLEVENINDALSELAKVEPSLVVEAASELKLVFKPCAETAYEDVDQFFTTHWINAKVPKVKNMPVLIGISEHEMGAKHLYKEPEYYESFNLITEYLQRTFDFADEEEFEETRDLVRHYYFGDEPMSEDVKWGIIRFDSDFTYAHPVQRTIRKYLESEAGNIYYYMFSYIGGRNLVATTEEHEPTSDACCASHSDGLAYLFDSEGQPLLNATDEVVMERVTAMWTNFAKYSNPTPEVTELLPVKWEPLTKENFYYMDIGSELKLGSRPHHRRMAFWNLFYKFNEQSQRWYQ
ncbi:juvenile hormone esterase-like [Anticarsia gemmatalis]|uniref:juvenile hormone esterase-like n=1 Tax=Anticarsia gemmatalis TaxID=129554 RepID=UPI003F77345C